MMWPDIINGSLEFIGGLLTIKSVRLILRDRTVRGIHWSPVLFFWTWGLWNLYYYPHLGQWFSLAGGVFLNAVNLVWLVLMVRYWPREGGTR